MLFDLLGSILGLGGTIIGVFENILNKFFIIGELTYGTRVGDCIDDTTDKICELGDKALENKKFKRFVQACLFTVLCGPIYIPWLIAKWTCILTWRLFKVIFRIGR